MEYTNTPINRQQVGGKKQRFIFLKKKNVAYNRLHPL